MDRRIVITGIGVISPIGSGKDQFWDGILTKKSGAVAIDRFDITDFKTNFACQVTDFEVPEDYRRLAKTMDLFCQYAFFAAKEAWSDSGLSVDQLDPVRAGMISASGMGGLWTIESNYRAYMEKGPRRISPYMIPMMMINASAGQIAIELGLQGPNFSTSSACASSQHAFGCALDLIRDGRCDVVVTGGSEATITPLGIGGFNNMKALSTRNDEPTTASRPFSLTRDGFVMGEGAGMFVFEEKEFARRRGANIYAEVKGFGMSDDSGHITAPLPDGSMAAHAMETALSQARLSKPDIDYVNAHGTSTKLNDAMETRALKAVFGDHASRLMVSSTKSQIGHLLGASGAVELAATVLGISRGVVPCTINYDTPGTDCDLDCVPNEPREKRIQNALSNSFGFGGHNASIVVGRFD